MVFSLFIIRSAARAVNADRRRETQDIGQLPHKVSERIFKRLFFRSVYKKPRRAPRLFCKDCATDYRKTLYKRSDIVYDKIYPYERYTDKI